MAVDGGVVQFPVAAVRDHAGTVDRVSDAVELARSAVHEITMDAQAFGQLCQFLPAVLSPVFGLAVDGLIGTVESLRETATALRAAAASTEGTDVNSERRIRSAGAHIRPHVELPL
jgi:hypothetical protein